MKSTDRDTGANPEDSVCPRCVELIGERDNLKYRLDALTLDFERVVEESNHRYETLIDVANLAGRRIKEGDL